MNTPTRRWWIEVQDTTMFSAEATGATADEALQSWLEATGLARQFGSSLRIDEGPTDPAGGAQRTITVPTRNVKPETVIVRPIPAE